MKPLLELKNITKIFRRHGQHDLTALDNVNFSLFPGEILGIVGESGSGKSTVAKSIARLINVTNGQIILKEQNIFDLKGIAKKRIYRDIQMVFQNPVSSFDPRRTLGHGISESLLNSGVTRQAAQKRTEILLQQCGLTRDFASRYPFEVSGGQCQRAAIARALAIEPEILICDEATSSLDVTIQAQIIELLRDLQKKNNISYIFICHDLALVQDFCDRILVMNEGKIVETGTPEEIINSPKSEYTQKLIAAIL